MESLPIKGAVRFLSVLMSLRQVHGHGAMRSPPARNVAWNDNSDYNGLNCGGYGYQWSYAQGRCGVCGDAWNEQNAGKYVYPNPYNPRQLIVAVYSQAQDIDVDIQVTANHRGYFVFRIGAVNDPKDFTQAGLDYVLKTVDGQDKWNIPADSPWATSFRIRLRLPSDLACDHCVLQWWWRCGNNWGCDPPPTSSCGLGYGPQENFVNCADVKIIQDRAIVLSTQASLTEASETQALSTTRLSTQEASTAAMATRIPNTGASICAATGVWSSVAGMNDWCNTNCVPPYSNCPDSMCSSGCRETKDSETTVYITGSSSAATKLATTTTKPSTTSTASSTAMTTAGLPTVATTAGVPTAATTTLKGVSTAAATKGILIATTTGRVSTASTEIGVSTSASTTVVAIPQSTKPQCEAAGAWKGSLAVTSWCMNNCYHNPPFCPKEQCSDGCRS